MRKSLFAQSTFTGKERDEETGYGYFGARYMDHELMTMWLSVDPMATSTQAFPRMPIAPGNTFWENYNRK